MGNKEVFPMTAWTLFLTIVGVAFLTAQLFRLIDLIERPSRRGVGNAVLPPAWNVRLWNRLEQTQWTSWKS